jgi:hypothetical protein
MRAACDSAGRLHGRGVQSGVRGRASLFSRTVELSRRRAWAVALLLAACAQAPAPVVTVPIPLTSKAEAPTSAVVRREVPAAAQPAQSPEASASVASIAPAAAPGRIAAVPAGTLYVCLTSKAGETHQTVISFVPKVQDLCGKHPEMGPCQYERNICRNAGGRVYTPSGTEITMATEAEYDRKVMRVRFKSN